MDLRWERAPKGEEFLELIEDEQRTHQLVMLGPELRSGPVQVLPQSFVGSRLRVLDPFTPQLVEQIETNLLDEPLGSLTELQPDDDRKQIFPSESGKDASLEQRRFPEAGFPEEH